ncbi:MAG: hypothetical protein HQK50_03270 [Oligoflexia bacterium]|nr:hypothetical protein [Oligoflexia bacterium]MBF0364563.1 hypothetical protein [Oligoflexia bacterium]
MRLEFAHDLVTKELFDELEFSSYCRPFVEKIPMMAEKILRPMESEQRLRDHFQKLALIDKYVRDTGAIISALKEVPALDSLLISYKHQTLGAYQLYLIGEFLFNAGKVERAEVLQIFYDEKEERQVYSSEEESMLRDFFVHMDFADDIDQVLYRYTDEQFQNLRISKKVQSQISKIDRKIQKLTLKIEQEVLKTTKLKMTYPYPREVERDDLDESTRKKIEKCDYLNLSKREGGYFVIEFAITEDMIALETEKEFLSQEYNKMLEDVLEKANRELLPEYKTLETYYRKRQELAYLYLLVEKKRTLGLCWPTISSSATDNHLKIIKGRLPILAAIKAEEGESYSPSMIDFSSGANVLFGANLSGKTTLLKTIYFLLVLTQVGLPVPAKALECQFPRVVALHLKSSGNLRAHSSSFSEELEFFSTHLKKMQTAKAAATGGVYLFVDELFHTTNPLSGVALSETFISYFTEQRDTCFVCTSHYPEILAIEDCKIFRMSSGDYHLLPVDRSNLQWMKSEYTAPLLTASKYTLPLKLLEKIAKSLET